MDEVRLGAAGGLPAPAWYAAIDAEWLALEAAFRRWLDPANFDAVGSQRLRLAELTRPLLHHTG